MPSTPTQLEDLDADARPDQAPPADDGEPLGESLAHYWRLLKDYYWIVVVTCALGVAGAWLYTRQQPEVYEAQSKIVYHQKSGNVFGNQIEQVDMLGTGGSWGFERFWNTQKEIFESRWFARRVAERAAASDDPLDHPLVDDETFLPPRDAQPYQKRLETAVDRILGSTSVSLQQGSRVAVVTVHTRHPAITQTIANRVAREYTAYTDEFQSRGLQKITEFFDDHVASKRQKLERAQAKLQDFKQDNNILSFSYEERQNLTATNMESANKELAEVRRELSSERALLAEIRQLADSDEARRAIAELIDNETLEKAFEKEAELETELGELETRYLDQHPEVRAVSRKLEITRGNIDDEIDRLQAAVANRVDLLERKEKNLERDLERLKQQVLELDKLGGKYSQLKNRKNNLREIYDTVLKRASELDITSAYKSDDIEVLERARRPDSPVSPSMPVNLAGGLLAGLVFGIGGIVLIDTLDTTIRSDEDVTRYTDKPILATLPKLDREVLDGLETDGASIPDTITHTAPKSSFAEGIKTLRTNLTFMSPDNPPRTLLVTSPGPGEGKTISSTNLAVAMAQSGSETLLVDTDLRRPRIHRALDLEQSPGVSSIIRGDCPPENAVQPTHIDHLDCLTSGDVPPNPSEMLHSEQFHELVEATRNTYDRVIFDSPPLAAVSDALIVSNMVDGMLLVVEFGKTRREMLARSLDQIRGIGAPLLGILLNEVSDEVPGYTYSYYYYYGDDADPRDSSQLAS